MVINLFIARMRAGGAERVCVNLANEWVKMGHEVHVIVLNLDGDVNTVRMNEKVHIHSLGASRMRYAAVPMLRYIRKNKPLFLLVFGNEMGIIVNKLKKYHLIDTPLIERVLNNINVKLGKEEKVSPIIEKYIRKSNAILIDMDYIVAQCNSMAKQLLDYKVVDSNKMRVIYNPVSAELTENVRKLRVERPAKDNKEITFIGRIDPQKNIPHLLQSFKKLHEMMPNTVLRLVGTGHMDEQMKEYATDLGISESVVWDGVRRDMENVYASSDLVVLTSEYEGLPNCLIEAIGCGIPVVSYDCPMGPAEIVVDGVNGYLVEYNNIDQMTEKMLEALNKEWNVEEIIKSCDKFRADKVAEKYIDIFDKVLSERR